MAKKTVYEFSHGRMGGWDKVYLLANDDNHAKRIAQKKGFDVGYTTGYDDYDSKKWKHRKGFGMWKVGW